MFPYLDVAAKEKAKEALIITASVPYRTDENPPDIAVKQEQDAWMVEVFQAERKLKLKIFDQNELPEFEVVDFSYKP